MKYPIREDCNIDFIENPIGSGTNKDTYKNWLLCYTVYTAEDLLYLSKEQLYYICKSVYEKIKLLREHKNE